MKLQLNERSNATVLLWNVRSRPSNFWKFNFKGLYSLCIFVSENVPSFILAQWQK